MAKPKVSWDDTVGTAWDTILHGGLEPVAEPDLTGVIYPKRERPSRYVDPYDLPHLHTRVLMGYLRSAQALGYAAPNYSGKEIPLADIKAELAKRPHVPNKPEAQALRRAKNRSNRKL